MRRTALLLGLLLLAASPCPLGADDADLARATTLLERARERYAEGRLAEALSAAEEALAIREAQLDPDDLLIAEALNDVGVVQRARASYRDARSKLERALEITREALGPRHRETAAALDNLASLYTTLGRYAEAEPLFRAALSIRDEIDGENGLDVTYTWNNLAATLASMGDLQGAEALYRRAFDRRRRVQGLRHPDTATAMTNLASLLVSAPGRDPLRLRQARALHEEALKIRRETLGPEHVEVAASLNHLGVVYTLQGEHARALGPLTRALEIREKALGPNHPFTTVTLGNLGYLYELVGEPEKAAECYGKVLQRRIAVLDESHPSVAAARTDVARIAASSGDVEGAEGLLRQALDALQTRLATSFAVLAERQQIAMAAAYRPVLDAWLGVAPAAGTPAATRHDRVLFWKGAVFARQAALRLQRGDPEVAAAFARLEEVGTRLSALLARTVTEEEEEEAWRAEVADLGSRWETLERDLARRSEVYRRQRAESRLTSKDIAALLPEGVLLVDLLAAAHTESGASEIRLLAFVVSRGRVTVALDLGALAPIAEAVARWRGSLRRGAVEDLDAASIVKARLWAPLLPHLEGITTVLLSPDDVIGHVPFAALPGVAPKRRLVEDEVRVATLSVPQWLPRLLAAAPTSERNAPRLLLVGNVDYGAPSGEADEDTGSRRAPRFSAQGTAGTRGEVLSVRDSFESRFEEAELTFLRRQKATEGAFRAAAPGARWIHVASHGFFEPAAPIGRAGGEAGAGSLHPGLRSGLALAGANRTPGPGEDDGILTALEVAALDLRGADLVVLSACETGLGDVVRGEGVLGLQRAFQVAQARTTVASLWEVDDATTRTLMERFYELLWGEEPIGPLEALRAAQRWMLQGGQRSRGPLLEQAAGEDGRLPAYYWAAFICSGDWR